MSASTEKRSRILSLVFTDLANSTALKSERGDDAVESLIARHRACVTAVAADCGGRIIDWAGDGCFLTFETSSSAVLFALRLQQAHADEPDLPGVRIGIHMGEVTEITNDSGAPHIAGLAVDLASRISGLARPGQVLMSAAVYDSARQRIGVESLGKPILWQAHGTYAVKGFDKEIEIGEAGVEGIAPLSIPATGEKARLVRRAKQPMAVAGAHSRSIVRPRLALMCGLGAFILFAAGSLVYFVLMAGGTRENAPQAVLPPVNAPIRSLAVLPLDNLSNDPDQEYFADGMTEAITSELAKIKALRVVSRTSAMQFKDRVVSMREIGQQLGVEGVIEGSVQRDGDQVKIIVQLIHAPTDAHMWTSDYTDSSASILVLQSRIALAIADALQAELTGEERQRIEQARSVSPEAHDAYLLGIHFLDQLSGDGLRTSARYFEDATRLDPTFAEAWARLANSYRYLTGFGFAAPKEAFEKARAADLRALEIDPNLSLAREGFARTLWSFDYEFSRAEQLFRQVLDSDPNSATAHNSYALYLTAVGRRPEAIEHASKAVELDPDDPWTVRNAQMVFLYAGAPSRGHTKLEELIATRPDFTPAHVILVGSYAALGDLEKSVATAERWVDVSGRSATSLVALSDALARVGQTDRAAALLEEASDRAGEAASSRMSIAYAILGDFDRAFEWMDRSLESRDFGVFWFRTLPYRPDLLNNQNMIRFRTNDRFHSMIEQVGYPPLPPEHPGYAEEQAWFVRQKAAAEASAPIRSIAVLPFDNLRADPAEDYFADGMTEALISELAKIKNIKIISRTSVMQYKNVDDRTMPEIARELGVDSLVEGSVLKDGNQVRITAQLIRGATDEHLWSGSFTNSVENVLQLQSTLALEIAARINAAVTPQESARIATAKTVDPEAYGYYLQGRQFWNLRTPADLRQAKTLFERAIAVEPDFALAHVGLADAIIILAQSEWVPGNPSIEDAKRAVQRALDLDPQSGEAYAALAAIANTFDWNWSEAERAFEKSLELSPGYATGHQWFGVMRHAQGRTEEAITHFRKARELDPASPIIGIWLAQALARSGAADESLRVGLPLLETYGTNWRVVGGMVDVYARLGRYEDALQLMERVTDASAGYEATMKAQVLARMNRPDEARAVLDEALKSDSGDALRPLRVATVYAALGEIDEAFVWLERAFEGRDFFLIQIKNSEPLDALRADPRYKDLLRRIGLPE